MFKTAGNSIISAFTILPMQFNFILFQTCSISYSDSTRTETENSLNDVNLFPGEDLICDMFKKLQD